MPNRLINETSPYLLQHAHNPVDWHPWGNEALTKARAEDKPILLSIGYSACHWCHVMERESFEDHETAALMNAAFVNIKVDREERPDLDNIYMNAVQGLTGQGGWPMTVFLTPEGVPFFGGTYFPPDDRRGMPSFKRVMAAVLDAYTNRRDDVAQSSERVRDYLLRRADMQSATGELTPALLDLAGAEMHQGFDPAFGGFGTAPKFPQPMNLEYLLRTARRTGDQRALEMVTATLDHMAMGGIHDQIGGGFHRYSTDARWLVPHFEKMLYDNAQLARIYIAAFQFTGAAHYRGVAEDILDYVTREMTSPEGGFYSTQDADSEGEEGKFFVWTPQELEEVLGETDALIVGRYYGVNEGGNFEGKSILWIPRAPMTVARELGITLEQLAAAIDRAGPLLYAVREQREHPARDEKVLTAWNGMMLRAFAEAAAVLDRRDYAAVAEKNAAFLLRELRRDGRLLRSYKDGRALL
ncbi:MAG: thioredoxin domain-containing protein, partial [Chloroflexi bacterium]|nr:thioredoxin domain-containing protein [Chloroflexota bacterium]